MKPKKLKDIYMDYEAFWAWINPFDDPKGSHWTVITSNPKGDDNFYCLETDYFFDIYEIGECFAVPIKKPESLK